MAYGWKPIDLVQASAQDVVDFFKGHRERLQNENDRVYDVVELIVKGKYRPKRQQLERTRYSDKVRKMIEEQDKKDIAAGKIKVHG
jgi:hypothetical protein